MKIAIATELIVPHEYARAKQAFEVTYFASMLAKYKSIQAAAKAAKLDRNTFRRHAVAAGVLLTFVIGAL